MSVTEYDFRRYSLQGLSQSNNYYNYDGGRGRTGVGRDESVMGKRARRRLAVAVSAPSVPMAFTIRAASVYRSFFVLCI